MAAAMKLSKEPVYSKSKHGFVTFAVTYPGGNEFFKGLKLNEWERAFQEAAPNNNFRL